jgi:hypothetical protein
MEIRTMQVFMAGTRRPLFGGGLRLAAIAGSLALLTTTTITPAYAASCEITLKGFAEPSEDFICSVEGPFEGEKGETGETGAQGATGAQGGTGAKGDAGTLDDDSVTRAKLSPGVRDELDQIGKNTEAIEDNIALSAAIPDSWLSDSENFAISLGGGFTDGSSAIGAIGTFRINKNLSAYGGGSTLTDGGTWAAKGGVRLGW